MTNLPLKLRDWHSDDADEYQGDLATEHSIFEEWQPAHWAIRQLSQQHDIPLKYQRRYWASFISFYLGKPHIMHCKTDWNKKFIKHCQRNHNWTTIRE
ncbi:MAG: DnaT-like ssDNA-binding domain-containing protein [Candidatus Thiodiazotropha taylori]